MASARKPAADGRVLRKLRARNPAPRASLARGGAARNELRLAGVGTAAVLRATGRPWSEWITVLDRAGARAMSHKDIALLLSRRFGVPDWWSRMVSVGYREARGLRAAHLRANGFAAAASRTVHAPVRRLFDAWSDDESRNRWLLGAPIAVSRSVDGRSLHMTWQPGESPVEVSFRPCGPGKSQVAVEQGRLGSAASARTQKAFWSAALERLKALIESGR